MTKATTIRSIGNSAGTTIPKAMLQRYSWATLGSSNARRILAKLW